MLPPPVPTTCTLNVPRVAVLVVRMVIVELPLGVTDVDENVAVAPDGRPVTLNPIAFCTPEIAWVSGGPQGRKGQDCLANA